MTEGEKIFLDAMICECLSIRLTSKSDLEMILGGVNKMAAALEKRVSTHHLPMFETLRSMTWHDGPSRSREVLMEPFDEIESQRDWISAFIDSVRAQIGHLADYQEVRSRFSFTSLGWNFSSNFFHIVCFSFTKGPLKMSDGWSLA